MMGMAYVGNSSSCKVSDHTCIGNSHSCKDTSHKCICTDHLHPKYWPPFHMYQVDISTIFFRQVSEEDHVTHQLTVFLSISDSCWKLWEVLTYHTKGHGEGRRKEGRNEELRGINTHMISQQVKYYLGNYSRFKLLPEKNSRGKLNYFIDNSTQTDS